MILATLSAALMVLCGFAALGVDVANGYAVKNMLQYAVDDGARTAQRWSAQIADPGVNPAAVQAQAAAEAMSTAQRDLAAEGLAGTTVVDEVCSGSQLRITARAKVGTWFLRVLGIPSWNPAASAGTALWTPALTVPAGPSEGAVGGAGPADASETAGPGPDIGSSQDTGSTESSASGSTGGGGGDTAEGW